MPSSSEHRDARRRRGPLAGVVALALAVGWFGCARRSETLAGTWQGTAGEAAISLQLRTDGTGLFHLRGRGHAADYRCTWMRRGASMQLTAGDQTLTLGIVAGRAGDTVLALPAAGGSCRLLRVSAP